LWQLESIGLHAWFDHIIVVDSTDPGFDKASEVHPYLKNRILERTLWIGDTEVDVDAARRLGVKICAVSCGLRTTDYLASLKPDFLFSDVDSIRLADLVAQ
jgi:phosphoglycolate phosphatase-like HAD superfamily hydrolase